MANTGKKYLKLDAGRIKEQRSYNEGGAEGDLVALNPAGQVPLAYMPTGIGPDTGSFPASEDLASGDFVNIWNDSGTMKARKADATAEGKEANGFVLSAFTTGNTALVYFEGQNTSASGLTAGSRYYLSAASPGLPTDTPPSGAGNVVQYLGIASAATKIVFEAQDAVTLAA